MLTLFASPKPFIDPHTSLIQRNAIESWTRLKPRPEIILMGDESGAAELCEELGLRHIPKIERDEYGTPLLSSLFELARKTASGELLCYVNADMILLSDFLPAVEKAKAIGKGFLFSGGRWGLDWTAPIDFSRTDWEEGLRSAVRENGAFSFFGNDYFVFPRGFYGEVPPFSLGRGWFDGWLFWRARSLKAPVIDASRVVMAIHQNHEAREAAQGRENAWKTKAGQRNFELAGLKRHWFLLEATHRLTSDGIGRVWGRKFRFSAEKFLREIFIYRSGSLRKALGLRRER